LLLGVLHYILVALLAVALLVTVDLPTYRTRVATVFLAGLIGSVFITLGNPIWFHLPWDYTLGNLLYAVSSWIILGLTVAAIVPR